MNMNPDLMAPCGLYCGVCAVYTAHRDSNLKFKELLLQVYQGKFGGKGKLPGADKMSVEDIRCRGCLSEETFVHCGRCDIRKCNQDKGYDGCHQCESFPCGFIDDFPMEVGKKAILRAVPFRREAGTEEWVKAEEERYVCPECGNKVFRGVVKCNQCRVKLNLD